MKKVMSFLAVVALIATVNTSCKKNYTCECCTTCGGVQECASATKKLKKKDAKAWCEGSSSAAYGCSVECKLK